MKSVSIMGYNVFADSMENIVFETDPVVINTLNAYSYVLAKSDTKFNQALKNSTVLVPDGFPVVLASRFLIHEKICKIAGADVFYFFCNKLNQLGGKCFLLGSTTITLGKIQIKMEKEYPRIQLTCFSPPFKKTFSAEENNEMISRINDFKPDVLFVGMTAPKQEKWVFENQSNLDVKYIASIGAVFDFYAETKKRAGQIWIKLNLEWFIRLIREPSRMWKRYLVYSPLFFIDMLAFRMNKKMIRVKNT